MASVAGLPEGKPGVLFVDDEEKALKYFERAYGSEFKVYTASDIESATRILGQHGNDIAILITDKRMPRGNGLQLLAEVKAKLPNIIRILTTAYHDQEDVIRAINQGEIYRYIPKPWDIDNLRAELLNAHRVFTNKHDVTAEKARCRANAALLLANLSHGLEPPLHNLVQAVEKLCSALPTVLASLDEHSLAGAWATTSQRDLTELRATPDSMAFCIQEMHVFLDVLIANVTADDLASVEQHRYSAAACVQEILQVYPLRPEQSLRVHVLAQDDFMFYGSDELLMLAMFNLLRNALQSIEQAKRGDVVIHLRRGEQANYISIRDTGMGIPEKIKPFIFDDYFTTKEPSQGLGLGLGFCKKALASMKAEINCQSVEGAYCEFLLSFPKHADDVYRNVRVESEQVH